MVHEINEKIMIINELGLHARAAASFVKIASKYKSDITVRKGAQDVNGKSIMGLIMLTAPQGTELELKIIGDDAECCVTDLKKLISDKFGEDQ